MTGEFYDIPFEMKRIKKPTFPVRRIRAERFTEKYGKNAISMAVESLAQEGGGTVDIGPGEWMSDPIHLKSNICLNLEKDARVVFSPCFEDYLPMVFTRWEGVECLNYSPLIYAANCENVGITGEGILYGNGKAWWPWKKLQQAAADELCYAQSKGISAAKRKFGTREAALRPSFVQFINCKNVVIEGVRIEEGPQWTLHPVYCENVIFSGVKVKTSGPNTDGLNPDSCFNVLIENCEFNTGDDCIAINSGLNEDGWRVNRPCKNILIRGCEMKGGHGGLVIGSAVSGGVENVCAQDCRVQGVELGGIRLKSMRGRGGKVKNIWFQNIEMCDIMDAAISMSMYYPYSTVTPLSQEPSEFCGIYLENIRGQSCGRALEILGLSEKPLKDIRLKNVQIRCDNSVNIGEEQKTLVRIENVTGLGMENVSFERIPAGL